MGAQAVRLSNVDIDNALKNKDFEVLFQPIFDLGNGALARVESFVRWRHRSLGLLPPGAFISFFESQGRMSELTRYVLAQSLAEYRAWRGANAPGFSINLALSDLADDAFASHFDVLLRDAGFPADLITLECPMPPVTMDVAQAGAHFRRLAATGARLAIEVRGRANDFLRQIEPFPFDEIKTGGAAILRFARTVRGPGLSAISELLEIATRANAAITAVGVEDQASLSALRGLGFAAAQGNHLGKVGALDAFEPARVNEVRALLGLEALSDEDLGALFRTDAPVPKPSETAGAAPAPAAADDDALVERLAQRLARQAAKTAKAREAAAEHAPDPVQESAPEALAEPAAESAPPAETKTRRSPLKAAAAKAAAIARAKRKAAAREAQPDAPVPRPAPASPVADAPAAASAAPARSLQERLLRAFDGAERPEEADEFAFGSLLEDDVDSAAAPSEDPAMTDEADTPPGAPPQAPATAALSIKGARAHFRPGLRVGVARQAPPQAPAPAPAHAFAQPLAQAQPGAFVPAASPAAATAVEDDPVLIDFGDAPASDRAHAPEAADAAAEAAPFQPEDFGTIPDETAAEEAAAPAAPAAPQKRRRRKKNFLTRTVIPYPTHFWPRSWRRAWKRRDAQRARARAEAEQASDAAQAAE